MCNAPRHFTPSHLSLSFNDMSHVVNDRYNPQFVLPCLNGVAVAAKTFMLFPVQKFQ